MSGKCLYTLLGLASSASRSQIKSQFYRLSKLYHPDLAASTDLDVAWRTARFNEITEAYRVLSDERLRRDYDIQHGHIRLQLERPDYRSAASRYHAPSSPFNWSPPGSQHEHAKSGIHEDIQRRWERMQGRQKASAQKLSEEDLRARHREDTIVFRNRLLVVGAGVALYLIIEGFDKS